MMPGKENYPIQSTHYQMLNDKPRPAKKKASEHYKLMHHGNTVTLGSDNIKELMCLKPQIYIGCKPSGTQFNVPQFEVFLPLILNFNYPKSLISDFNFFHLIFSSVFCSNLLLLNSNLNGDFNVPTYLTIK
jgi:hypothetical protein